MVVLSKIREWLSADSGQVEEIVIGDGEQPTYTLRIIDDEWEDGFVAVDHDAEVAFDFRPGMGVRGHDPGEAGETEIEGW